MFLAAVSGVEFCITELGGGGREGGGRSWSNTTDSHCSHRDFMFS